MVDNEPRGYSPGTISTGLLHRAQKDDATAWTRMVTLYSPLVYFWCRRLGIQPNDADDIAQNVFKTVSKRLANFQRDGESGSFRGWLRTITRNKIGDYIRARQKDRLIQLPYSDSEFANHDDRQLLLEEDSEEQQLIASETHILFKRILELMQSEFADSTWKAFLRVVVDDVAPKDVARELDLSVNSVYLAKSRVLRKIRDEFGDEIPESI